MAVIFEADNDTLKGLIRWCNEKGLKRVTFLKRFPGKYAYIKLEFAPWKK